MELASSRITGHVAAHVTLHADGTVIVEFDRFRLSCPQRHRRSVGRGAWAPLASLSAWSALGPRATVGATSPVSPPDAVWHRRRGQSAGLEVRAASSACSGLASGIADVGRRLYKFTRLGGSPRPRARKLAVAESAGGVRPYYLMWASSIEAAC
jgi:hypothetical protein